MISLFKRKKRIEKTREEELNYFKTRDSLTGQRNLAFAVKEFEKIKRDTAFGAVLIRVKPDSAEDDVIADVSVVISAASANELSRISRNEFLIFCRECEREADRLFDILNRVGFDELLFAVGAESFDENEADFDVLLRRLKRAAAAAEIGGCRCAVH